MFVHFVLCSLVCGRFIFWTWDAQSFSILLNPWRLDTLMSAGPLHVSFCVTPPLWKASAETEPLRARSSRLRSPTVSLNPRHLGRIGATRRATRRNRFCNVMSWHVAARHVMMLLLRNVMSWHVVTCRDMWWCQTWWQTSRRSSSDSFHQLSHVLSPGLQNLCPFGKLNSLQETFGL